MKEYLSAAVKTPPSDAIENLIREVNGKRRSHFEQTEARTGATLEQVQYRFYQLAVEKTEPGHYYQDQSGKWVRK